MYKKAYDISCRGLHPRPTPTSQQILPKNHKNTKSQSSGDVEGSSITPLKTCWSETDEIKKMNLFPAEYSLKTFLWTHYAVLATLTKITCSKFCGLSSKNRKTYFFVSDFFLNVFLRIRRRQFDSAAKIVRSNSGKNRNCLFLSGICVPNGSFLNMYQDFSAFMPITFR